MATTRLTRLRGKASTDREALDALLDAVHVGHFGFMTDRGPVVLPTAVIRDGNRILAHGSTGSGWMRKLATGLPTALAITAFDGLVVARSAFESSMHYRSAVLFGTCSRLDADATARAMDLITEALLPQRTSEVRRPTARELAATMVLALPITRWSLKVSNGWPEDPADDVAGSAWAGVIPSALRYGSPRPAPDLRGGIPVPPSVRAIAEKPE